MTSEPLDNPYVSTARKYRFRLCSWDYYSKMFHQFSYRILHMNRNQRQQQPFFDIKMAFKAIEQGSTKRGLE